MRNKTGYVLAQTTAGPPQRGSQVTRAGAPAGAAKTGKGGAAAQQGEAGVSERREWSVGRDFGVPSGLSDTDSTRLQS